MSRCALVLVVAVACCLRTVAFASDDPFSSGDPQPPKPVAPVPRAPAPPAVPAEPPRVAAAGSSEPGHSNALLIASAVIGGAVYLATPIGDHLVDPSVDFPELWIPALGPWLAILDYDSKVNPNYPGRDSDKMLFALSGAIQVGAAVVIIVDLARRTSSSPARGNPSAATASFAVTPSPRGLSVLGTFQ